MGDTVKPIKNLRDMFDTTSEIAKLLKYSPKRNSMFHNLKDELVPETPGFRTLCPTTVCLLDFGRVLFFSIEVCRDCIPALASSCKKQLTGFFVCLLFFLKVKRIS